MKKASVTNQLGTEKISKLVLKIALPSMIAQFISVLYSIIDRIFVGNIEGIGDLCLAGIGVCAPILTFITAFSILVGIGGGPLLGISLGENNKDKATKILNNSFIMLIIISILVIIIGFVFKKDMLYLFGASDNFYEYADQYFTICLAGIIFPLLGQGMYQFILAQGYAKTGMFSIVIGAILNICLDPLFIFVFNMGISGAAIATIISQAASMIFVLIFLFFRSDIKIRFYGYSLKVMSNITKLGISPFLIISLDAGMLIAFNAMLKAYGGADGDFLITVNTIVNSYMLCVTLPLGGISGGTQCILAYNYGAGNSERVIKAQRGIQLACVIYTTVLFIFGFTCGRYFIQLFSSDPRVIEEANRGIMISASMIIPLGIQYAVVDGFTALGQVKISLFLSLWRKSVYFLCVFTLPIFMATNMIFYSEPVGDIAAVLMSVAFYFIFNKKILRKREHYLQDHKMTIE